VQVIDLADKMDPDEYIRGLTDKMPAFEKEEIIEPADEL
jgi:hypothetical protein